jgi:hypothetical protein
MKIGQPKLSERKSEAPRLPRQDGAGTAGLPGEEVSFILCPITPLAGHVPAKEVGCLLHVSDFLTRSSTHHMNLNLSLHVFGKTFPTVFQ